ncbi:GNAT family N-acetyltransferase [Nocardioides sp. Root140]|uniref:GNAT family N-acetyltransferase n=1 Tax=Nocardioides sp. Root140 TaxID=1736460 RepID=UPI0006F420D0|nr:GNAT family N-acetyltransferase [Nocardioides sp. Root140]KQY56291.1 hypothetical protein ASD30_08015 [Nocardioides sp. Root140]
MESVGDSHDVGMHRLGPHVVGRRVVVRRVLRGETGPSGGPAMTDVLGVCTAWADGVCVVEPATGPAVVIQIADIVSGKPVPPRPSVRHRVSAREAESHATALWAHVERAALGEWELRCDPAPVGRLLKRANSCLAIGDPGTPYAEAESAVRAFYAARSRDPLVQVETGSEADEHFTRQGWQVVAGGDSHFQLASLAQLSRALRGVPDFSTLLAGDALPPMSAGLAHDGPRLDLSLRIGDQVVASAKVALSGEWLGIHAFGVEPAFRRRGLARRMLAELVEWGGEKGASTVWLHVETDNQPALALYGSLGFATHHTLRYLSPD